jgi:hypothetical protein
LFFYYHRSILLYGDAVAHINIARRVIDSQTPGLFQLGTVWLPLPHLLDVPFIANDFLWRSGLGASIPSMAAYVAGVLGIFRLVRGMTSRGPAWIAAGVYGLNPNLLYMQVTAMAESLYLAFFIWTVVYFSEFCAHAKTDQARARNLLQRCGVVAAGAMLVRYDGWVLAFAVAAGAFFVLLRLNNKRRSLWRAWGSLVVLAGLTAALWMAYNYANFHNALAFANGPYSASAIAKQSVSASMPTYPGQGSPRTAALYFLKVSRLNLGEGAAQYLLFTLAFVTLLAVLYFARRYSPWILLWIPVPFYLLNVAWGSIPIYFPDWWPHSYYNVRYGLQMLPAAAVFVGLAYEFLSRFIAARWSAALIVVLAVVSYASVWRKGPVCLREARVNGQSRMFFDEAVARELEKLPSGASLMMYCGGHPGALQDAGIPFRRVLNEGNHPQWTLGLGDPADAADFIIAFEGDDVARAVRLFPKRLRTVVIVGTPGQPRASIYQSVRYLR